MHTNTESCCSVLTVIPFEFRTSNLGIPGVWVFHIGSSSQLKNVVPAAVGQRPLSSFKGHLSRTPESTVVDQNVLEGEYPDTNLDYAESFYNGNEDDFEYFPIEPTEPALETRSSDPSDLDDQLGYHEPRHSGARLDSELESLDPPPSHLPPYPDLDSVLSFFDLPTPAPSASEENDRTPSLPLVYEAPIEAVTAVLLYHPDGQDTPSPPEEDGGVPSETEALPVYPDGEVILESFPDNTPPFSHRRRVVGVDEDVGFNPDGRLWFSFGTSSHASFPFPFLLLCLFLVRNQKILVKR